MSLSHKADIIWRLAKKIPLEQIKEMGAALQEESPLRKNFEEFGKVLARSNNSQDSKFNYNRKELCDAFAKKVKVAAKNKNVSADQDKSRFTPSSHHR